MTRGPRAQNSPQPRFLPYLEIFKGNEIGFKVSSGEKPLRWAGVSVKPLQKVAVWGPELSAESCWGQGLARPLSVHVSVTAERKATKLARTLRAAITLGPGRFPPLHTKVLPPS